VTREDKYNKKMAETKHIIDKEALKKYSWGMVSEELLKNRDKVGASYAIAQFGEEGSIHDKAFMYEQGIHKATDFLKEKYAEIVGDSTMNDYMEALGTSEDIGEIGKLALSDIEDKLNGAMYILKKKSSTDEEKLAAQEEAIHYQNHLGLIESGEGAFTATNKASIAGFKRDGLVQKILEENKRRALAA